MPITPLFAAIFGIIYIGLSLNVIRHRFTKRISLGAGGDSATDYAMRAHGNFIEYVPLALLLFYFLETISLSSGLVFYLASTLLLARILHSIGMFKQLELLLFRQLGTVLTLLVILVSCVALALRYIPIGV